MEKNENLHPVRNTKLTPHDIIMVDEAVINVDIYGVGLANTCAQL
jgi:hypothetical protein